MGFAYSTVEVPEWGLTVSQQHNDTYLPLFLNDCLRKFQTSTVKKKSAFIPPLVPPTISFSNE